MYKVITASDQVKYDVAETNKLVDICSDNIKGSHVYLYNKGHAWSTHLESDSKRCTLVIIPYVLEKYAGYMQISKDETRKNTSEGWSKTTLITMKSDNNTVEITWVTSKEAYGMYERGYVYVF